MVSGCGSHEAEVSKPREELVPPLKGISIEKRLTRRDIRRFAYAHAKPMVELAKELGMKQRGPLFFIYKDANGDFDSVDTEFTLQIVVPVENEAEVRAPYQVVKIPQLKCYAVVFRGSMYRIEEAWDFLVDVAGGQKYELTGERREIFEEWYSFESKDNVTELQLGVK